MARLPDLVAFAREHGLKIGSMRISSTSAAATRASCGG